MLKKAWREFTQGKWQSEVNVRDFIQENYAPYFGGGEFLSGPTDRTVHLWEKCKELLKKEMENGDVLSVDADTVSTITSYAPGYIEKSLEVIVGLQTDSPLKRGINPFGGIRMVKEACSAYGYTLNKNIEKTFTQYRKTHNQGVFDAYTEDIRKARKNGIITGLPDAYGRGRIIGDYRRIALYGVDFLINEKENERKGLWAKPIDDEILRLREEATQQIKALLELKSMALSYNFDISGPADNALEAVQWLYFGYLAAIKESNGAAMSLGRTSTFLDIYIERDLKEEKITQVDAQEIIDQFIIKLRLARQLRTPEYNELFAGDPLWITEGIGGMGEDGRPLVTKTSFRFLQSLNNLGPAPEPNLTILWSDRLPAHFKNFCSEISIKTNTIQYENDEIMRPYHGDDYAIACCVSAMTVGKQMQFFGARCNIPKILLLAINEGIDEKSGNKLVPDIPPLKDGRLTYEDVITNYNKVQKWVVKTYTDAMNTIHFMHDKYAYESIMMALHDIDVKRLMAFGIAGLSVAADSLSSIKFAKVYPVRDQRGIAVDFKIDGEYPAYGNDQDSVDDIAVELVKSFREELGNYSLYRQAVPTLSILTITSNVVYGKKTGSTPDGRKAGEPFAPGANPMAGRDKNGVLSWLSSVSKLPYETCRDGISCTLNLVPSSLGRENVKASNLSALIDGYFKSCGHHINVNIISRETLIDAMKNPDMYQYLTIRVSGYAVHFNKLTTEQKLEVINRTYHSAI